MMLCQCHLTFVEFFLAMYQMSSGWYDNLKVVIYFVNINRLVSFLL